MEGIRLQNGEGREGLDHFSDQDWPSDKNLFSGFRILFSGPIHVRVGLDLMNWEGVVKDPFRVSLEDLGSVKDFNFWTGREPKRSYLQNSPSGNRTVYNSERCSDWPQTARSRLLPTGSRDVIFIRKTGGDESTHTSRKRHPPLRPPPSGGLP